MSRWLHVLAVPLAASKTVAHASTAAERRRHHLGLSEPPACCLVSQSKRRVLA